MRARVRSVISVICSPTRTWPRQISSPASYPPGDFSATRADTFHQITLPETFFGWLNVTPRVGGRFTYYGAATGPGATNLTSEDRGVFNTGAEISFKASRVWEGAQSDFWDVGGLRHIIEPSINYVYIPQPNVLPSQVPQFDYELTNSLRMLPIDFPDYNAIDTINSQNTIRFGLDNRLQTKRNGENRRTGRLVGLHGLEFEAAHRLKPPSPTFFPRFTLEAAHLADLRFGYSAIPSTRGTLTWPRIA